MEEQRANCVQMHTLMIMQLQYRLELLGFVTERARFAM
jgi:hypothetical protein